MAGTTVVRRPGEGDAFWMLNSLYEVRATGDETGGELTVMEMTIPAGMGPPPHEHPGGESVYVLEGRVRYHIAGETHEGGPGTFFYIPGGVEENFEPAGAGPVRLLVIYTPGGMDRFFAEAGEPAQRREVPVPSQTPPDLERLAQLGEKYGLRLKIPSTP
ncbi:MAG: cupin domain-containing protein [Actinomycetota bacterium]